MLTKIKSSLGLLSKDFQKQFKFFVQEIFEICVIHFLYNAWHQN